MVDAIVDLAGEDKDLGKQVADSIGILSKFMKILPEELAARMSAPMGNRVRPANSRAMAKNDTAGAFSTLLPLIVSLRELGDDDTAMKDCVQFFTEMVVNSKDGGGQREPPDDSDPYNTLLSLAVELDQELDKSHRSKSVVQSCVMYLQHMLTKAATSKAAAAKGPAAKRARTSGGAVDC